MSTPIWGRGGGDSRFGTVNFCRGRKGWASRRAGLQSAGGRPQKCFVIPSGALRFRERKLAAQSRELAFLASGTNTPALSLQTERQGRATWRLVGCERLGQPPYRLTSECSDRFHRMPSTASSRSRFWWSILRHLPQLFWTSANRVRTVVAVLILLVGATSKQWGKLIASKWEGIPGRYVWIAIGLFLLWGIMRAIYERDAALVKRLAAFESPPVGAERKVVAENQLKRLDDLQKMLVKQLLIEGSMTEGHAVAYMHSIGCSEVREFLAPIDSTTNFLSRNFVGRYEINPAFRDVLQELLGNS